MDLNKDKLNLIKQMIKDNPKMVNNEDLMDAVFDEVCERVQTIISLLNNEKEFEKYVKKVVPTSILSVLKCEDRLNYDTCLPQKTKSTTVIECNHYKQTNISYDKFYVEDSNDNILIPNGILEKITNIVSEVDDNEPSNQYLQIYKLRYDNGMTQKEIAELLGLSQIEVCKRLFQLMEKVKSSLG